MNATIKSLCELRIEVDTRLAEINRAIIMSGGELTDEQSREIDLALNTIFGALFGVAMDCERKK